MCAAKFPIISLNFFPKQNKKIMKKQYNKPSMEAVEMKVQQMLAGSDITNVNGNVFDDIITGSSEVGRAPEFQDMPNFLFGE